MGYVVIGPSSPQSSRRAPQLEVGHDGDVAKQAAERGAGNYEGDKSEHGRCPFLLSNP